jgi:hypothetical protein
MLSFLVPVLSGNCDGEILAYVSRGRMIGIVGFDWRDGRNGRNMPQTLEPSPSLRSA